MHTKDIIVFHVHFPEMYMKYITLYIDQPTTHMEDIHFLNGCVHGRCDIVDARYQFIPQHMTNGNCHTVAIPDSQNMKCTFHHMSYYKIILNPSITLRCLHHSSPWSVQKTSNQTYNNKK